MAMLVFLSTASSPIVFLCFSPHPAMQNFSSFFISKWHQCGSDAAWRGTFAARGTAALFPTPTSNPQLHGASPSATFLCSSLGINGAKLQAQKPAWLIQVLKRTAKSKALAAFPHRHIFLSLSLSKF